MHLTGRSAIRWRVARHSTLKCNELQTERKKEHSWRGVPWSHDRHDQLQTLGCSSTTSSGASRHGTTFRSGCSGFRSTPWRCRSPLSAWMGPADAAWLLLVFFRVTGHRLWLTCGRIWRGASWHTSGQVYRTPGRRGLLPQRCLTRRRPTNVRHYPAQRHRVRHRPSRDVPLRCPTDEGLANRYVQIQHLVLSTCTL